MKRVIAFSALALIAWPGLVMAQDDDDGGGTDDILDDSDPADDSGGDDDDGMKAGMSVGMDTRTMASSSAPRHVLPKSQLYLEAFLEINLSKDSAFKPISIQPDLWYGVNDDLTVGVVHSSRALSGFIAPAAPGGGLCLGAEEDCPNTYSGVGILARYHLLDAPVSLAADGGLVFGDFDPFILAIKLGVVGDKKFGKISVLFGANVSIGVTERDAGNKEFLNVPVAVMYEVMPKLTAGVQSGLRMPFSNAGDFYTVPLSFGARYIVTPKIIVDASFSLPLLLTGVTDASGVAARVLTLGGAYVF